MHSAGPGDFQTRAMPQFLFYSGQDLPGNDKARVRFTTGAPNAHFVELTKHFLDARNYLTATIAKHHPAIYFKTQGLPVANLSDNPACDSIAKAISASGAVGDAMELRTLASSVRWENLGCFNLPGGDFISIQWGDKGDNFNLLPQEKDKVLATAEKCGATAVVFVLSGDLKGVYFKTSTRKAANSNMVEASDMELWLLPE